MAKVEVFSTLKEADQKLRIYFSKNADIVHKIFTELQARHTVYRQSADFNKRHAGDKNAALTVEELLLLSRGLGKGEVVTSLVKLYAFEQSYGLDYTVFTPKDAITFIPYESIAALTASAREQIELEKGGNIGLKNVPLFYTVLEPFTYSGQDKRKAREAMKYDSLSLENKVILDHHLDTYLERGLTPTEIKEFVAGYVKFLN